MNILHRDTIPRANFEAKSGSTLMQVEDGPLQAFKAGDGLYEEPGPHQVLGEAPRKTEPVGSLAVLVVDANDNVLTTAGQ